MTYKFKVEGMDGETRAEALKKKLESHAGVTRVDYNFEKKLIRIVTDRPIEIKILNTYVGLENFSLAPVGKSEVSNVKSGLLNVNIEGTTCRACELSIEKKFKQLPGVKKVDVNAASGLAKIEYDGQAPTLDELDNSISEDGYRVRGASSVGDGKEGSKKRPSLLQLAALFIFVFLAGTLFSKLGLLRPVVNFGNSASFASVFLIGLVAASSSCIAVSGGLLLSAVGKYKERYGQASFGQRTLPIFLFVSGRLVSYGILGGVIGWLGNALSPSPLVTGIITLVAAVYMLVMGLQMLNLAPRWLLGLMPRLPKFIGRKVMSADSQGRAITVFLLGAGTFFLPCGFTQALQLYALTTGSFLTSAQLLFGFALGTAPALILVGLAASSVKGKIGTYFSWAAGAVVIVLGLWNIQNGFTIAGYPLSLPSLSWIGGETSVAANSVKDPNVSFDGKTQVVKISVTEKGYAPNSFTLRQNVPARLVIDGTKAGGCLSVFQVPKLNIKKYLQGSSNVIEFTPTETGPVTFSCSMGMYRGQINVVPNNVPI